MYNFNKKPARNLYKRKFKIVDGVKEFMPYEGECNIKLTDAMQRRGYKTNIWLTYNQATDPKHNYTFGNLRLKPSAEPVVVRKYDYRTEQMERLCLYNIDQTEFATLHPARYQHFCDEYAETYHALHQEHQGGWLRRVAAMF